MTREKKLMKFDEIQWGDQYTWPSTTSLICEKASKVYCFTYQLPLQSSEPVDT